MSPKRGTLRSHHAMISIYDFGMTVKEYLKKFLEGARDFFPKLPCAKCKRFDKLKDNGYYWRFVIGPDTGGSSLLIPVHYLYCRLCLKITVILRSFCIHKKVLSALAYETFFFYVFFTNLPMAKIIKRAKGRSDRCWGYHQLGYTWIKSFKNNIINLTAEIRTFIKGFHKRDTYYTSCRYSDLLPTWWGLQNLAYLLFPEKLHLLPLERAQYLLVRKRRVGIFGYLT